MKKLDAFSTNMIAAGITMVLAIVVCIGFGRTQSTGVSNVSGGGSNAGGSRMTESADAFLAFPVIDLKHKVRQDEWMTLVPALKQAALRRHEITLQGQQRIDALLKQVSDDLSTSLFSEYVCGWEATWEMLTSSTSSPFEQWVQEKFRSHVFDHFVMAELLVAELHRTHTELAALDTELLVALQADVPLVPEALEVPLVDLSQIDTAFVPVFTASQGYLTEAWGGFALGQVVGSAVAGTVATGARAIVSASSAGKNDLMTAAVTTTAAVAADYVASEMTESAVNSRGRLADLTKATVQAQLAEFCSGNEHSAVWTTPLWTMAHSHESALLGSLIDLIGVDRDWAMSALKN